MKRIAELMMGAWLLLGCMSCATSPRESAAGEAREETAMSRRELNAQFTTDVLSEEQLQALEVRAQQKLLDFMDYVSLMRDTTLEDTFQTQAEEQASQLFVSPAAMRTLMEDPEIFTDSRLSPQPGEEREESGVQDITLVQPLVSTSDGQYRGVIGFRQPMPTEDQEKASQKKIAIWVKKVEKQFGNERETIWEVFLGAIE